MKFVLAIDQGTSSTKTLIFDNEGKAVAKGCVDLKTNHFDNGFVEQDPEGIYQNVLDSVQECLLEFQIAKDLIFKVLRLVESVINEKPLYFGIKQETPKVLRLYGLANVQFQFVKT